MSRCDRCLKPLGVHRMSWFNTDRICGECQKVEEAHPDYRYARNVEHQEVRQGNTNYTGVGWPGVNGRVSRPR